MSHLVCSTFCLAIKHIQQIKGANNFTSGECCAGKQVWQGSKAESSSGPIHKVAAQLQGLHMGLLAAQQLGFQGIVVQAPNNWHLLQVMHTSCYEITTIASLHAGKPTQLHSVCSSKLCPPVKEQLSLCVKWPLLQGRLICKKQAHLTDMLHVHL